MSLCVLVWLFYSLLKKQVLDGDIFELLFEFFMLHRPEFWSIALYRSTDASIGDLLDLTDLVPPQR